MWHRLSITQTRFILWMVMNDVLKIKVKLRKIGSVSDDLCTLCGLRAETVDHLFFQCVFSKSCLELLKAWLNIRCNIGILSKLDSRKWGVNKATKGAVIATLACLAYQVWKSRNEAVWMGYVRPAHTVVDHIKFDVRTRLKALDAAVMLAD